MSYRKKVVWLIAISLLLKLLLASATELGNVEAYYWALSTRPEWNYFDHPPMVAWLIRLSTCGGIWHRELLVRLGAIICSSVCVWLMFSLVSRIHSQRTGWYAALLYTASLYASIGAGAYILPDSPQMVFWLLSLSLMIRLISGLANGRMELLYWALMGLTMGLCIMSKVHGVFLWFGFLLYLLAYDRSKFKGPALYLALMVSLITVCPIFIWNFTHQFINYRFQGARIIVNHRHIGWLRFGKELLSVFFITGPINFVLICTGVIWSLRKGYPGGKQVSMLLLMCSMPLIGCLLCVSLFRETYPHWSGPAFSTLLTLPAMQLASVRVQGKRRLPPILIWAIAYIMLIGALQVAVINYFPGSLAIGSDPFKMGQGDDTLDDIGWNETGLQFKQWFQDDVKRGLASKNTPIIAPNWMLASRDDYYISYYTGQQTIAVGDVMTIHQYYWMNQSRAPLRKGDDAYLIIPSNVFSYRDYNRLAALFKSVQLARVFPVYRSGVMCKQVFIYRMLWYK